jgi:glycosyltransferase involved in cell wall biosynthesis
MKKVLIITYFFPPRPRIASLRLGGLAKYLPRFGWEPTILTPQLPAKPDLPIRVIQTPYPGDVSQRLIKFLKLNPKKKLEEQIGIPQTIRESKHPLWIGMKGFIAGFLAFPDEQKAWYPLGVRAGEEILKNEKFDALISSFSPVTSHRIAWALKNSHAIPWIADFRDLWTQDHYYAFDAVHKWIDRRLEIKTISSADALVTISKPYANRLAAFHQNKKIFVIQNGFDPDEIRTENQVSPNFTITYTGQLMQGRRDPVLLLHGLHELISSGQVNPADIAVHFWGRKQFWLEQEIKQFGLAGIVTQCGESSRTGILPLQRQSQILLLLNWNEPREEGVYTGKVFEYLAARRPILAVGGPRGVITELLEQTKAGIHVNDLTSVKQALLDFYNEYKTTGQVSYPGSAEEINKYSHVEMAKKFAEILTNISKQKENSHS